MNAVVSATAGRAVLLDGDRVFSIEATDPATLVPRTPRDLPFLLGEGRDLEVLERVTVDEVRARLEESLRHDDALRWTLTLLDGDYKEDTRIELAKAAEEVLRDAGTRAFVEGVLYAQPFPADLDPEGAEAIAERAGCTTLLRMLRELGAQQAAVETVHRAWEGLPSKLFGTENDRKRARAVVVREGLFRSLIGPLTIGASADAILAAALTQPRIRALPHHREILSRWARSFAKPSAPRSPEVAAAAPNEAFEDAPESRPEPRARLVGHAAMMRVEAQQAAILEALRQHDVQGARVAMAKLMQYHAEHDPPTFAVMSLCNMAAAAQRGGARVLQDEWTAHAVSLGPKDGWAWNQRGKALLDLSRPLEALAAYDQAELFRGGVVAECGRAEVLKTLGRFDEALRAYDRAVHVDPDSPFGKTGRAGVLKAMGSLEEALRAYDEAVHDHPENVVAKSGRAEVLKVMGRLDDALQAYNEIDREHPEDVVAKTGRASVLALMGRSKEALRALPDVVPESPQHWIACHLRAMILLRTGKADDALRLFEDGVRACPFEAQRAYFRNALAVARLRKREYAAAAEVLAQLDGHRPIVPLLQVHAFGELAQYDKATAISKTVSPTLPEFLDKLRREVDDRYVRRTGAKWTDDELFKAEVQACLLAA